MRLDLRRGTEFVAQHRLETRGAPMRVLKLEAGVELDVEADRKPIVEDWTVTWCTRVVSRARDQHDAFEDGLVVRRDRTGETVKSARGNSAAIARASDGLDLAHAIERQGARDGHAISPMSTPPAGRTRTASMPRTPGVRQAMLRTRSATPSGAASSSTPMTRRARRNAAMPMSTATTSVALASALA